jgi:Protein of unknown function (DUF2783)
MALTTDDNEHLFEALAQAVDRAGPAQAQLLLAKLVLLLANQLANCGTFEQALIEAEKHLE